MPGFVYFLRNPSMPGLLKIGFTDKPIDIRLRQLQSTGVAEPFAIDALFRVVDAEACESSIHKALECYRVNPNREFFQIETRRALDVVWLSVRFADALKG